MIFAPCTPAHLAEIMPRAAVVGVTKNDALSLLHGMAFSGWHDDKLVGCAGVLDIWQDRAMAWALLTPDTAGCMRPITRFVKTVLAGHPARRIEAYVRCDFVAGIVWARMLGLQMEGKLSAFSPDGADHFMFARVRQWP